MADFHRSQYNPQSHEGLPPHARERLARAQDPAGRPLFSSDLSVNEFVLLHEAGFEPLGLVMGTSMYQIGYQRANWNDNIEMTTLTQAMYDARELAMTRMEEEADILGADGIAGVRLEVIRHAWGQSMAEFMAIGTAVKATRPGQWKAPGGRPFTSDLSGQNLWTLLRSGHRPVALVMGTCVYHIAHRTIGQWFKQAGRNAEMTNFTQALYDARELALERMQSEAQDVSAKGVVGVEIEERTYGWDSHVIEYFAIGTAIAQLEGASVDGATSIPEPAFTLSLNDPARKIVTPRPSAAGHTNPAMSGGE
jgi:uncharacterized protein YbjQ (UPF0145 family)